MEITGKIIQALDEQSGVSKAGNPWKKKIYVLETADSFPKKVAFDFFGDKVDQYPLAVGDNVRVSYDIESREYNGRWYTDIHAWRAEKVDENAPQAAAPAAPAAPAPQDPIPGSFGGATEDLPF